MNFTTIDLKLMHYLFINKAATYEQIHRDIYPEYNLRSVINRINKMYRRKLVTIGSNRMFANGKKFISISKTGFNRHVSDGLENRTELKSDVIGHDLRLLEIRRKMLQLEKVKRYYTENEIQTWGQANDYSEITGFMHLHSDALLKISLKDIQTWVGLEYENTQKKAERYIDLASKYYGQNELQLVLFIAESDEILGKVKRIESKLFPSESPLFFYQTYDRILQNESITFQNMNNFEIKF